MRAVVVLLLAFTGAWFIGCSESTDGLEAVRDGDLPGDLGSGGELGMPSTQGDCFEVLEPGVEAVFDLETYEPADIEIRFNGAPPPAYPSSIDLTLLNQTTDVRQQVASRLDAEPNGEPARVVLVRPSGRYQVRGTSVRISDRPSDVPYGRLFQLELDHQEGRFAVLDAPTAVLSLGITVDGVEPVPGTRGFFQLGGLEETLPDSGPARGRYPVFHGGYDLAYNPPSRCGTEVPCGTADLGPLEVSSDLVETFDLETAWLTGRVLTDDGTAFEPTEVLLSVGGRLFLLDESGGFAVRLVRGTYTVVLVGTGEGPNAPRGSTVLRPSLSVQQDVELMTTVPVVETQIDLLHDGRPVEVGGSGFSLVLRRTVGRIFIPADEFAAGPVSLRTFPGIVDASWQPTGPTVTCPNNLPCIGVPLGSFALEDGDDVSLEMTSHEVTLDLNPTHGEWPDLLTRAGRLTLEGPDGQRLRLPPSHKLRFRLRLPSGPYDLLFSGLDDGTWQLDGFRVDGPTEIRRPLDPIRVRGRLDVDGAAYPQTFFDDPALVWLEDGRSGTQFLVEPDGGFDGWALQGRYRVRYEAPRPCLDDDICGDQVLFACDP